MAQTGSPYDWAGAAAILAVIGGAIKWLWSRAGSRDARISAREEKYVAKVEARLRELDDRMGQVERAYGLVVGVAHVMIDDLILVKPQSPALVLVSAKIREAYPLAEEIPGDMLHLLHRLDAHQAIIGARQ